LEASDICGFCQRRSDLLAIMRRSSSVKSTQRSRVISSTRIADSIAKWIMSRIGNFECLSK